MVRIPTLIPESAVDIVRRIISGTLIDILWKLFVIVTVGFIVLLLASLGGIFYAAIVSAILYVAVSNNVRNIIYDVWERDFWVFSTE